MRVFLSYPLNSKTPSYGGRDSFDESINSKIINGEGANTSKWVFSNNHIGTHIDTPFHFINSGKKTLDYSADEFYFENIFLVHMPQKSGELIDFNENEINKIPKSTEFLIIQSDYYKCRGTKSYIFDNPGLSKELANKLSDSLPNLRAIGFDFISLTSWNHREHGRESHKMFLGGENGFIIVEDMDLSPLSDVKSIKNIIIAPVRTDNGNGGVTTIIAEVYY
jgi:kynurenine formamidase